MTIDNDEFKEHIRQVISEQNKILECRPVSPSHTAYIKTAIKFGNDEREFVDLLKCVFSHHDVSNFRHIPYQDVNIGSQEDISRYFHHQKDYYQAPTILQGQHSGNPTLSYDEFFERIIGAANGEIRNHLSFLVGSVGIGKTTFLCNFVSRNVEKFLSRGFLPVKINLDISTGHTIPDNSQILTTVKQGILAAIYNTPLLNSSELERFSMDTKLHKDADDTVVETNLSHTVNQLKSKHGLSIVLILDNIDFLYHLGDRGFFAQNGEKHPERSEIRKAHETIVEIINIFWRQQDHLSSRLGIPIIVACRRDTISFLMSKQHEVPIVGLEDRIYSLEPPTLEDAKVVVEKRFNMLAKLSEKISEPTKRDEFVTQCNKLKVLYAHRKGAGAALLDDLWKISRKGLRDMINQISEFSWLEFLDGKKSILNARFTQQYYPSMLAYMLSGYRRYTQFSGNVPNIYLINAPSPSNEMGVPADFKNPHIYTLWLKRLILQYLSARREYNTSENDVVNMFCGKNRRGYSEDLVRYVLSSLFEVPTSELIEVDVAAEGSAGAHGYVRQIEITERGQFILDECADSFKYLQIMVDDFKILLPKNLHGIFGYIEPDYSYLVAEEHLYGQALNNILLRKGNQTFLFAVLIEESLHFEKRMWPKVFARLSGDGINPLEKSRPTERIRKEITSVQNSLRRPFELNYLLPENERRARALIVNSLEELYSPCKSFRSHFYGSW